MKRDSLTASRQDAAGEGPYRQVDRGLTWRRLLSVVAIVATVAMAIVAVSLTDIEAAAVAFGFGISGALLRTRKETLGVIGLTFASAVTLFFMMTAAITNVRSGSPLSAVGISAGLAAIASVTLVSSGAVLAGRAAQASRGTWTVVAVASIGFVAALGLGASTDAAGPDRPHVVLVAENVAFSRTEISAPAGESTVSLANKDLFWHTFTVPELDVDLFVPVGAQLTVSFTAPEGVYEFVCRIPGHREAGMVGTLTVGR